jgi:hypothetical protein
LVKRFEVPEPRPQGGAIIRFLVPPEGELVGVDGFEEARAQEGVLDVRIYRDPGHVFGPRTLADARKDVELPSGYAQ